MLLNIAMIAFVVVALWSTSAADSQEVINKPPYFLPGTGDFLTFSIPENFEVGTSVYKLKGKVPHATETMSTGR